MTIYDYDTATAGHDGGSPERGHSTHAVVDRLSVGEPYAVVFGGQGGAWLENLEELVSSAGIESELNEIVGEAELLLEPVARELVVVRPIGFEPMQWVRALAAEEPLPATKQLTSAAISFPGILLTQMAAIRALTRQGLDLTGTPPVAMAGHSQGVLGVESLKAGGARDVELLAMAQLIGAAGSLVSRRRGMVVRGGKSPMVSVTNADPDRIAELLEEFATGRPHGAAAGAVDSQRRRAVVITGTPEQLSRFELYCQQDHREGRGRAQEQAARRRRCSGRCSRPCRSRSVSTRRGWPTASRWSTSGPKKSASTPNSPTTWPRRSSCVLSIGCPRSSGCARRTPSGSSTWARATPRLG